jgi:tRNA(Ile)-lysidine synthase
MNLARKAGVDGLSGLRREWRQDGITWHRPLLAVTRGALRAHLRANGIAWAEDPTNDDPRRTRARARQTVAALAPLGLTVAGLARVAGHLADAADALRHATADFVQAHVVEVAGSLRFGRTALAAAAPEIRRRVLRAVLQAQTLAPHPPREAHLHGLTDRLLDGRDATLAGVRFRGQGDVITASRELRAVAGLVAQPGAPWDNRWRVTGPGGAEVRALGAGLAQVPGWRATGLPRAVLEVTPGVWQGDRLIAAPVAGWPQGWTAENDLRLLAIIKAH